MWHVLSKFKSIALTKARVQWVRWLGTLIDGVRYGGYGGYGTVGTVGTVRWARLYGTEGTVVE